MPSVPEWVPFSSALGLDLDGPQRGGGVGGEERVAGAAGEDHDPALLEVADGPAPDVGLGDLRHVDGGLHPGGLAQLLERVLQGQGVDDRGQHAHVVGLGAVHARRRRRSCPARCCRRRRRRRCRRRGRRGPRRSRGRCVCDDGAVDAVAGLAGEGLARELEQDPLPARRPGLRRSSAASAADDDLGEADERGVAEELR